MKNILPHEIAGRPVVAIAAHSIWSDNRYRRIYHCVTEDGLHWEVTIPRGYAAPPVIELQLRPEMVVLDQPG